jgi:hypothetical protein
MIKTKFFKSLVIIVIMVTFLGFPRVSYGALVSWPDMVGFSFKQVLETIMSTIQNMMRGALKQAAVQMINNSVNKMISGSSSSGSLIVNDPYAFLYTEPDKKAMLYMKDFWKYSQSGRGSGDYVSSDSGSEGVSQNYSTYLVKQAEQAITPQQAKPCDISASKLVNQFDFRTFSGYLETNCNTFGYNQATQETHSAIQEQYRQEAAQRYQVGRGFKDVEKNGQVVTPGSTIQEMQAQVQDIGNKVVASSTSIPEVITSLVSKIATQAIRQGIGNAQSNSQKNSSSSSNFQSSLNNQSNQNGPGTFFKPRY